MPRLPGYEGSQSVSTQQGQRVDPRAAGQVGRGLQQMGGGFMSLANEIGKMQDAWDKAKVSSQYTVARNNRKAFIKDLIGRAKLETDHEALKQYQDEMNDFLADEVQIDDENVREIYDSEVDLDRTTMDTDLTAIFRTKMVQHTRGEIVKNTDAAIDAYVDANPLERQTIKELYQQSMKLNRDVGFISNAEYAGSIEDMGDWEYRRALKDVGRNPEMVLENLDQYDFEDKNKANEIVNLAKANITRQKKIDSIFNLEKQAEGASRALQIVNNPALSFDEKIHQMNVMEAMDELHNDTAADYRRMLQSGKALNQANNLEESGRLMRMMYDANTKYINKGDPEAYLKDLHLIQRALIKGEFDAEERTALQRQLDNLTKKNVAEATAGLEDVQTGTRYDKERMKKYKAPIEFFDQTLPSHMRNEALRNYFYRTGGEEVSPDQAKVIMTDVARTIRYDKANQYQKAFDDAIEGLDSQLKEKGVTPEASEGAVFQVVKGKNKGKNK